MFTCRPHAVRFPIAHDCIMIHKFNLPFRIVTGHKLGASRLRMAPEGLFKACPPAACTIARPDLPARLGTPVDLRSTSIRGRGFTAYLSACGGQLLNVRCAHYAGGASLTTFGFVTIVPRYLLPQVMPSHSFAALTALVVRRVNGFADRPMPACTGRPHAPRRGIGVRTRQRHLAAARAKKNLKLCAKQLEVKKFPAPCYSPIVNYTVPSPLEPLTTVFGKGTCVSAPLSAPEKITIKKTSPGIISKIQSSRLSNIC